MLIRNFALILGGIFYIV